MKIRWQSFLAPRSAYLELLAANLRELAAPGTVVEIAGLSPGDAHVHVLSELRCSYQVVAQNLAAAEQGCDAVVIGHFQDGGVRELRSALDIPVVGLGEAAMHHAVQLGESFGLVTINPGFLAFHRRQVRGYGLDTRCAGVRAMETDAATYLDVFAGDAAAADRVLAQFAEAAGALVAAGADVIVPAGGLPALLLNRGTVPDLDGATVLDPLGIAIGQAELWARLGPRAAPGRRAGYARPGPGVVDDFRGLVHPDRLV